MGAAGIWGNVVTATAALAGVFLGLWHARYMRRLDRQEERRVEQRKALADVLVTGRELQAKGWDLISAAALTNGHASFRASDGFRSYVASRQTHDMALLSARLVVRDDEVRIHLERLTDPLRSLIRAVNMVVEANDSRGSEGMPHTAESGAVAFESLDAYGSALQVLEHLTRQRVVSV